MTTRFTDHHVDVKDGHHDDDKDDHNDGHEDDHDDCPPEQGWIPVGSVGCHWSPRDLSPLSQLSTANYENISINKNISADCPLPREEIYP